MRQRAAGAAAVLAVLWGLGTVVAGPGWLLEAVLVVVVVTLTGAGAGHLRARPGVVVGAQVCVLVLALTVIHAPAQAVWGLLPGPAVWQSVVARTGEAVQAIQSGAAPLDAGVGLRLVMAAGAGALAILVDAVIAARRPALAGLPLLVVHAVAVVFAPGGLGAGPFLLALVGFLLVLAAGGDHARGWGVLVTPGGGAPAGTGAPVLASVSALSVVSAVLVALALPGVVDLRARPALFSGAPGAVGASTSAVDPLLDLRRDLGDRQDTVLLRYTTDDPRPQPLRVATVDTFTGDLWEPGSREEGASPVEDQALPPIPGLDPAAPVTRYTAQVTVEGLRQQALPVPYPVEQVSAEGEWVLDPGGRTVVGAGNEVTRQGQQYQVRYLQVDVEQAQLAAAPAPPEEVVQRYTQLPPDLPPVIAQTAADVVAGQDTAYARAVALQEWFRTGGGFQYTLSAPDPRTSSALADFLSAKEGYCVHFAATMAVMARTLGIPARVAVGFLPGTRTADGWQVSVRDAHAWPELYLQGAGWVRFEPTPASRSGQAPSWTVEDPTPAPADQATPGTAATAPVAPSRAPEQPPEAPGANAGAVDSTLPAWLLTAATALPVLAAGLVVLAAPRLAREVTSRRRWRRAEDDAARVEAAWADLVEQVSDLGVAVSVAATPRQTGHHLVAHLDPDAPGPSAEADAVRRLVSAVELVRYGAPAPQDRTGFQRTTVLEWPAHVDATCLQQDVSAVVTRLAGGVPARTRRRWQWSPPSGRRALTAAPRAALRSRGHAPARALPSRSDHR